MRKRMGEAEGDEENRASSREQNNKRTEKQLPPCRAKQTPAFGLVSLFSGNSLARIVLYLREIINICDPQ